VPVESLMAQFAMQQILQRVSKSALTSPDYKIAARIAGQRMVLSSGPSQYGDESQIRRRSVI
jgi:sensor domain CHASE-containing protein